MFTDDDDDEWLHLGPSHWHELFEALINAANETTWCTDKIIRLQLDDDADQAAAASAPLGLSQSGIALNTCGRPNNWLR